MLYTKDNRNSTVWLLFPRSLTPGKRKYYDKQFTDPNRGKHRRRTFDLQGVGCEISFVQEVSPSLEHGANFGGWGLGKVGKGKLHTGRT